MESSSVSGRRRVLFSLESLLEAFIGSDAFIGEPLSDLLSGDISLFSEYISHVFSGIWVVGVVAEPSV